jgi:hypothetical protein
MSASIDCFVLLWLQSCESMQSPFGQKPHKVTVERKSKPSELLSDYRGHLDGAEQQSSAPSWPDLRKVM